MNSKGKVVLIRPKNIFNYSNYPPLSLLAIGSVLKMEGYYVKIIDASKDKKFKDLLRSECKDALVFGITAYTSEVRHGIEISDFLKKNFFDTPIVWGGCHATLLPEQVCKDISVDYVIVGEGEYSFLNLVNNLKDGNPTNNIMGVLSKNNIRNKNLISRVFLDLEKQPPFDYSLIDINKYMHSKDFFGNQIDIMYYESSRGCPYRCAFCINIVTHNQQYRKKSSKKVLDEVELLYKKYKFTSLNFIDDNFCIDANRFREICKGLIERNIRVSWFCECRADYFKEGHIDDDMLKLAKKSGLSYMTIGLESGSPQILKMIKKDITIKQSLTAVKKCSQYGIIPNLSFIIGFPGEKKADVKKTLKFVNKIRKICPISRVGVSVFTPYPKCEITEQIIRGGFLKEPKTLRDWIKNDFDKIYTQRSNKLPWQEDPKFVSNASFYFSLAMRLSTKKQYLHYLKNWFGLPYLFFIFLAKFRLKFMVFALPFDKALYTWLSKKFLRLQYLRQD